MRRSIRVVDNEISQARAASSNAIGKGLDSVGQRITDRSLSGSNAIDVLHNGEQVYPAMLAAIEQAKQRVLLATYILKTDHIGAAFVDALSAVAATASAQCLRKPQKSSQTAARR